jgi:hypothetical protein
MSDARTDLKRLGLARLAVGLAQGLLLLGLHLSAEDKRWPATEPLLFHPLVLTAALAPVMLLAGVGVLRLRTLLAWGLGATAVIAVIALHAAHQFTGVTREAPPPPVWIGAAALLFIAHHVIAPADIERRLVASYAAYFDLAWKDGVRLALSLGFLGAFWLLLHLGAALFAVLGLNGPREIIREPWFIYPVSGLVFAAAVHLTDVRPALIRGVRTVILTLLAWLLPMLVLIAGAFVLVLPVQGVGRLWGADSAAGLTLCAAAAMIVLINTAYQDGAEETQPNLALRLSAKAGALLLPILIGLAGWAVAARVAQYGLTPQRVWGIACVLIGGVYAVGYAIAAVRRTGRWMGLLERTNLVGAVASVLALAALFTPLADPARVSVAHQVSRLENGGVATSAFDYQFLRFDAGRYGLDALDRLARSDDAAVAAAARKARAQKVRAAPGVPVDLIKRMKVFPSGAALPDGFLDYATREGGFCGGPGEEARCEALVQDINRDGVAEVIVFQSYEVTAFGRVEGGWRRLGHYQPQGCAGEPRTLQGAEVGLAPADEQDLIIEGRRLSLNEGCADAASPPSTLRTAP